MPGRFFRNPLRAGSLYCMTAAFLFLWSCGGGGDSGTPTGPASVASVSVSPTQLRMAVGESFPLEAVARDGNGNTLGNRTITWSTTNGAVASVSSTGVVTALTEGPVSISATSEGKTGTAALTIAGTVTFAVLPSLGGDASALAINDAPTIVGSSRDGSGQLNAVTWTLVGGAWTIARLPGGLGSQAYGINSGGDVVGGGLHAMLWVAGGQSTPIDCAAADAGRSAARAINSSRMIAGSRFAGSLEIAVVWRPGQCYQDLAPVIAGTWSEAYGIDDAGDVTGFASDVAGNSQAVRWSFNGTSWNAPVVLKDGALGGAEASNGHGDIVGGACVGGFPGCDSRASLWPYAGGTRQDLGSLGGPSNAYSVNSTNEVVGWSKTFATTTHAFIWFASTGMLALTPQANTDHTEAHGVNNVRSDGSRQVVGFSITGSGVQQAMVWRVP